MLDEEFKELLNHEWDPDVRDCIIELQTALKSYKMFVSKKLIENIKTLVILANSTKSELELLKSQ